MKISTAEKRENPFLDYYGSFETSQFLSEPPPPTSIMNFSFVFIASLIYFNGALGAYVDFGKLMGNEKEGRTSQMIFVNYGDVFPTEPYPHKRGGPTMEIAADERYLLPAFINWLVGSVIFLLSTLIALHLLRRRPIDHFEAKEKPTFDRSEEAELTAMKKDRKSDHSRLFFYTRRTNHVATAHKLRATFGRDFDPSAQAMSDEEYAQKTKLIMETVKLSGGTFDDDEGI